MRGVLPRGRARSTGSAQATDLPGGGQSTPRTMLGALTTEMLVHTWDLAEATDQQPTAGVLAAARAYGRDPEWRAAGA